MDDNEFEAYTRDAVRELREKIELLHTKFYFDSVARWDFDLHQVPGTLRFFDKNDNLVWICDVFEIGSFSPSTFSWKWAWSNNSLQPNAREQALPLKQLQKITGRDYFGFEPPSRPIWTLPGSLRPLQLSIFRRWDVTRRGSKTAAAFMCFWPSLGFAR